MSISAFVLISLKELMGNSSENVSNYSNEDFKNQIKDLEDVDSIFMFMSPSQYNAIVKITTPTMNSLYKLVIGKISKFPQVRETKTMIVMDK